MKITYKVVNKAGNDVSFDFDTKDEAENYIKSKPDEELSIKEEKSLSFMEGLLIGGSIISYKFFGISGGISFAVGYFLFEYLKNKYNIYINFRWMRNFVSFAFHRNRYIFSRVSRMKHSDCGNR